MLAIGDAGSKTELKKRTQAALETMQGQANTDSAVLEEATQKEQELDQTVVQGLSLGVPTVHGVTVRQAGSTAAPPGPAPQKYQVGDGF